MTLIYMTKHRDGQWSLEDENGICRGAIVHNRGRLHLTFDGVQNDYAGIRQMCVTFSLLGHRIQQRKFVPRAQQ
jgi:hypothetical protein